MEVSALRHKLTKLSMRCAVDAAHLIMASTVILLSPSTVSAHWIRTLALTGNVSIVQNVTILPYNSRNIIPDLMLSVVFMYLM